MDTQATAREQKKYICPRMNKFTFYVPFLDEVGKPVYETIPSTGQVNFINNKPVAREERRHFAAVPINPKKPLERSCFYVLEPNDKRYDAAFASLERIANDASSGVYRMADYEKIRNPAAFDEAERRRKAEAELEAQRKAAQEANIKAETLSTKILEKDEALIKAKDELSEKDRQLAEAHEKMDALMKGDTSIKRKPGRPANVTT